MRISEVAEKYGISADTLRYYERAGLLSHVHRTESGVRDYDEADCARIEFVKCMRAANVSIDALATYVHLLDQGDETVEQRRAILIEQRDAARARLAELQAGLDLLDYKIANYDKLFAGGTGTTQEPEQASE